MKSYDVVVIGGGVIGTAVAFYLSTSNLEVCLVERGDIASGTSSKCDGNILIMDKQPGLDTKMTHLSQLLYKELQRTLDYDFEYTQKGSLYFIESEEEMAIAENYVRTQAEDGYPMQMMDYKEIHEAEPFLAEDVVGGVRVECDASLNPMALSYGLAMGAAKNKAKILCHCKVEAIKLNQEGAIEKVVTDKGSINTKYVVNCAGVWAPDIGNMVGIDVPIYPRQGQILVSEKCFQVGHQKIMEFGYIAAKLAQDNYERKIDPELQELGIAFVFEPTEHNNFLIGSSRTLVGFDTRVTHKVMRGMATRAIRFFPVLKDINVIRSYAGLRPYVPDHLPIISEVEQVPGFYIAAGHEGDGVGQAPITGKLISQLISRKKSDVPVDKISFSRFMKKEI
jgi:glycine/D-amino acid oxidase-like deaminating enzyme